MKILCKYLTKEQLQVDFCPEYRTKECTMNCDYAINAEKTLDRLLNNLGLLRIDKPELN